MKTQIVNRLPAAPADSKNRSAENIHSMKTRIVQSLMLLCLLLLGLPAAHAASGTWTNLSGGTWSTAANWLGGTVADASTFTATKSPEVVSTAS